MLGGSCSWVSCRGREVAHVEIYEEKADIHKAFVREEVKVTKVVEQETVEAKASS